MKILNFAHFFKETRSVLELNGELPHIERGYPKDGNIMLSLNNEKGERRAFKLSMEEASRIVFAISNFINKHEDELSRIGSQKSYSGSNQSGDKPYPDRHGQYSTPKPTNYSKPEPRDPLSDILI